MTRLALALALLVAGAALGLAALVVHATAWGLPLGAAAAVAVLVALPPGVATRLPYALGLTGLFVYAAQARPEGDYLVGADPRGYGLLLVAVVVLIGAVVSVPHRRFNAVDDGL